MVDGGGGKSVSGAPGPITEVPSGALLCHFKSTNPEHLLCAGIRDPEKNKLIIHPVNKCSSLLSTYYAPSTVLCTGNIEIKKIHAFACLSIQHILTKHLRCPRLCANPQCLGVKLGRWISRQVMSLWVHQAGRPSPAPVASSLMEAAQVGGRYPAGS